jgi:two-component system chemotaxis response regulator CheB
MKRLAILIADDSVVYRSQIREALIEYPWADIIGVASNGKIAIERMQQGQVDLLILDLEMPIMDGLETLSEMKRLNIRCKVIVFSSASKRGSVTTFEALNSGATEFVTKPGADGGSSESDLKMGPAARVRALLAPKILALFPEIDPRSNPVAGSSSQARFSSTIWDLFQPQVIVIGSSTGGPTVLETIFSETTLPLRCPILITQHMPPIFTATLAERIQRISGIPTFEATDGQLLENAVYIAPGNFHMRIAKDAHGYRVVLDQGPLQNSVRPAVDPLFSSAAQHFKSKCLGIVLTGMGADGKVGAEAIKAEGGTVLIQEEKSCVVFGMPGAVKASGAYDREMSPQQIISALIEKAATLKGMSLTQKVMNQG